jgi:hypothetical protein
MAGSMGLLSAISSLAGPFRLTRAATLVSESIRSQAAIVFSFALLLERRNARENVYNILWGVVFGFATLNILSLAAKRLEPRGRGMSFGEVMAVTVVLLSIFLLGWEMLGIFHVFPIKLKR